MTGRDFDLVRRLEAVELALGIPANVPILQCADCGHEVAALVEWRAPRVAPCPACGLLALSPVRFERWPPQGPA